MAYQYICLCLVLMPHIIQSETCLDYLPNPCWASNHAELDDATRSTAYTHPTDDTANDYSLVAGWYRSVSPAGGDMPMTAPEMLYCKATNPIWLNGPLPTEGAGIVMRTACARRYANVCHREYPICIKNCGTFNVYYLQTALTPDDRYCFGSESQCPNDQTSTNGYSPGCHDICLDYGVFNVGDGSARSALQSTNQDTLCDAYRFSSGKYYRMVGDNGADFVLHEGCVNSGHCSTVFPVWVKMFSHPKDQNVTELTACTTNSECCSDQWHVKVKLCYHDNGLGFYVYQLSVLLMCDMAYCVMPIEDLSSRPTQMPLYSRSTQTSVPTDTPIPVPSSTPKTLPTTTPMPVPTTTPMLVPASTPIPVPSSTPKTVPTSTPMPVPSSTPKTVPTTTPIPVPASTSGSVPTSIPTSGSRPQISSRMTTKSAITVTELSSTSSTASTGKSLSSASQQPVTEASEQVGSDPGGKETLLVAVVVVLVILVILGILGVLVYCLISRARNLKEAELPEKGDRLHSSSPVVGEENLYHDIADGELGNRPKSTQYEQLKQKEESHYDKLGPVQDSICPGDYEKPVSFRPFDAKPDALKILSVD